MSIKKVLLKTEYGSIKEESLYTLVRAGAYGLIPASILADGLNWLLNTMLPFLQILPEQYKTGEVVLITGILLAVDKYIRKK